MGKHTPHYNDTELAAIIAKGKERARNGETNRPLTEEQYALYLAARAEARADNIAMDEWGQRGCVSGPPNDSDQQARVREPGVDWSVACEHGYSGIHRPAGQDKPCEPLLPETDDLWLQPSYAPARDPEPLLPRDARKGMYPPRGEWGAKEDATDALMSAEPHATTDGGGLVGVEGDYWLARAAMSEPRQQGPDYVGRKESE